MAERMPSNTLKKLQTNDFFNTIGSIPPFEPLQPSTLELNTFMAGLSRFC